MKKGKKNTKTTTKQVKAKSPKTDDGSIKSRIMKCNVSGIERRVSKAGVLKGIKKFGSLLSFTEHYIGNEAKKLLRQRISPEEVQKQLRPGNLKPFSIDHQILARQKLLKKPKRSKRLTEEEAQQVIAKWKPAERRFYATVQEYVIANTKNGSCIAPHVYLDSDRCCDSCKYTEWCLSPTKQFSKRYKR